MTAHQHFEKYWLEVHVQTQHTQFLEFLPICGSWNLKGPALKFQD